MKVPVATKVVLLFASFVVLGLPNLCFTVSDWSNLKVGRSRLTLGAENENKQGAAFSRNEEEKSCRWKIIVSANAAYEQDFLNWYGYCQRSGLCPKESASRSSSTMDRATNSSDCDVEVVLYAEDETLYRMFNDSRRIIVKKAWEIKSKYTRREWINGSTQLRFMFGDNTGGFRHMVSRRPTILLQELEAIPSRQINTTWLLYMDLDTMILQDPRPYFQGDYDFWAADAQTINTGPYNTGMLALRPTPAILNCIRDWRNDLENQEIPTANQPAFNRVVREMNDTIRHQLLPKDLFPVGRVLVDQPVIGPDSLGKDVVVFHNNWCVGNCTSKPERAQKVGLWNPIPRQDVLY